MFEVTRRMSRSKKLQQFIAEQKSSELESILTFLLENERVGNIGHGGSDGQYTFDVRGLRLKLEIMVDKLEFNEGLEVIEYLRGKLNSYWTNIINHLENRYNSEEQEVAICNASISKHGSLFEDREDKGIDLD